MSVTMATARQYLLVLCTDTKARLTRLTGWPLELGICALTGTTLTDASAIADLTICCYTWSSVQGTVACTASVIGIALTHTTPANTVSCNKNIVFQNYDKMYHRNSHTTEKANLMEGLP